MKVGRNDPCLCGSGRKFKHCCIEALKSVEAIRGLRNRPPPALPAERTFARFIDVEQRTEVVVSNDVLFNQLRRDGPRIVASFDALCSRDLDALNAEVCTFVSTVSATVTSAAPTGEIDQVLRATCLNLLMNGQQTFVSALEALRLGFRLQPGILVRNILETASTVCHLVIYPRELESFLDGRLSSTQTIAAAKRVIPPFGRLYGLFSDEFAHIGRLHNSPNPLREYSANDEALATNLRFLRTAIWLINVVAELAFFDALSQHRYFRKLSENAFLYAPSESEQTRIQRLLEPYAGD